jgi:tetratricopeptide (TPR) repeat protein
MPAVRLFSVKRIPLTLAAIALFVAPAFPQDGIGSYYAGNLAGAEQSLRSVFEREPGNARSSLYLVCVLADQNKLDDADAVVRKTQEAASDSPYARMAAARLHTQRKELDQAQAALDEAAKNNPEDGDLLFLRGMLNTVRQSYQAAVDDLERAIAKNPGNAFAHYYAGLAYNGLKRPDKMVEHFQHFLRLAPNAPEAKKVQSVMRAVG